MKTNYYAEVSAGFRASVIIVNFNQISPLAACLSSLQPTLAKNDEVIVVDNHSSDSSIVTLTRFFPWIRLIASDRNLGFGGGNNLGAKNAKGKYLAFLNPDTIVETGWLDILIDTLESHPSAGLVTPKILHKSDPLRINTCGNSVHITGLTLCRGGNQPKESYQYADKVGAVSGAAFLIESDWYQELGGFDETLFLYLEDTDLSIRSRLAGRDCIFEPNAIVYHDYQLRLGQNKLFFLERNRYLLLLKNYRLPTLVILLPALFLSEIITWGFVILEDRKLWREKLRSYSWILNNWKNIIIRRFEANPLRKLHDRDLVLSHTHKLDFEQVASGLISKAAHLVFDPLFFILITFLYLILWW